MRSRGVLAAGLAACLGFPACGASDGDDPLRQATDKTLSAPYLVVSQVGGRELFLSRKQTVIKGRVRVIAWTASTEEFTWRAKKHCYERSTDFNRDDLRQQREALVPRHLSGLRVEERKGVRVLSGREEQPQPSDTADTEFELRLDGSGRLAVVRWRSARFGVLPAGRWYSATYRYPTAAQFAGAAGPAPRPRCR
jgi:hypothetical protein